MPTPDGSSQLTVSAETFLNACRQDISRAKAEVEKLKAMPSPRKTQDVLEGFDAANSALGNAASRASLARNVHPDKAVREAASSCEQEIDQAATQMGLDKGLYEVIAALDVSNEDTATRTWISRALKQFRRSGVDRDDATREKVKALNEELVKLGQQFSQNIAEDVRRVELAPADLAGMPEDYIKSHPLGANGKVSISTETPDYSPFMMYAKSSKAREQLWRTYRQRANKNLTVLSELLQKRHELATLLGYPHWAAYATEMQMTGNDKAVGEFIDRVNKLAESRAKSDMHALLERKRKDVPKASRVDPWEVEYYEDKVRAEKFGFDSQAMRPYFEYDRVKRGAMEIVSRLFGVSFKRVENASVWHPDVEAYDVSEQNQLVGRIYLDMHPRADKYKHMAQFDLVTGQLGKRYPEGVLVCNFPKPGEQPALMLQSQAETLFHEFGHLMHHTFAGRIRWFNVAGIRTEHDFVEVPSMLLQEWMSDGSALRVFAKHYQTGADLPETLVKKLVASKEFGVGMYTRRQLYLAAISLDYHQRGTAFDTTARLKELAKGFQPFRNEHAEGTHFQTAFGHLEGYSANYYTYLWSVVIARDLLSVFQKDGYLNAETAGRLRKSVLDAGGSRPAAELVKDFLGRDYDFGAYERYLNGKSATASAPQASAGE